MDKPPVPGSLLTVLRRSLRVWLELGVAVLAMLTSTVSIWLSLNQGDDMARLVQAQSWPYLDFDNSNVTANGAEIALSLRNAGVGPARVRSFAIRVAGEPVSGWPALLRRCCADPPGSLDSDTALWSAVGDGPVGSGVTGAVLRPGDQRTVFRLRRSDANVALWKRLDKERFTLDFRVCYCSVFNECWTSALRGEDPVPVAACPVEPVPYGF